VMQLFFSLFTDQVFLFRNWTNAKQNCSFIDPGW
jgi:hypothetical protein